MKDIITTIILFLVIVHGMMKMMKIHNIHVEKIKQ